MAPLDTGSLTHHLRLVDPLGRDAGPQSSAYETLGSYLRATREHRGLSLSELATSTRIRGVYLSALEDGDRSALPSRPFAIGYVRSYAKALGLDGELAVQRFKLDWPETDEPLRNPVGVKPEADARRPLIYAGVAVLVVAVAVWNIAQRALVNDEPPSSTLSHVEAKIAPPAGAVKLGAPVAAPTESTTPPPYVVPGMDGSPVVATSAAVKPGAVAPVDPAAIPSPVVFAAHGAIFGAPVGAVLLQAKRPSGLVVRGADKTVYFARQLAAGEAFRAPVGRGLTAEATDPAAFDLYVGGALKGTLVTAATPIDKLAPATAAPTVAAAPSPAPTPQAPADRPPEARDHARRSPGAARGGGRPVHIPVAGPPPPRRRAAARRGRGDAALARLRRAAAHAGRGGERPFRPYDRG